MATSFQMLEHEMRDRLAAKNAEITSLRAELAEVKARIAETERCRNNAENALEAANARIAELEGAIEINKVGVKNLRARAECAEARIAELEARLQRQYAILLEHKSRAEKAEAHIKELNDKWADDILRVERAEAAAACYARQIGSADAENANLRDAVKRAEAELDISRGAHRMVQSALLSQAAETERVEAQLLAERSTAAYKDVRIERAEAERDAMREAAKVFLLHMREQGEVVSRHAIDLAHKLDAALTPSPAEREG